MSFVYILLLFVVAILPETDGAIGIATLQYAGNPRGVFNAVIVPVGYLTNSSFMADAQKLLNMVHQGGLGDFPLLMSAWNIVAMYIESELPPVVPRTVTTTADTAHTKNPFHCFFGVDALYFDCSPTRLQRATSTVFDGPSVDLIITLLSPSSRECTLFWRPGIAFVGSTCSVMQVAHTFGHAVGLLGDEFSYGYDIASVRVPSNCENRMDTNHSLKGCGSNSWFHTVDDNHTSSCVMQDITSGSLEDGQVYFCEACRDRLRRVLSHQSNNTAPRCPSAGEAMIIPYSGNRTSTAALLSVNPYFHGGSWETWWFYNNSQIGVGANVSVASLARIPGEYVFYSLSTRRKSLSDAEVHINTSFVVLVVETDSINSCTRICNQQCVVCNDVHQCSPLRTAVENTLPSEDFITYEYMPELEIEHLETADITAILILLSVAMLAFVIAGVLWKKRQWGDTLRTTFDDPLARTLHHVLLFVFAVIPFSSTAVISIGLYSARQLDSELASVEIVVTLLFISGTVYLCAILSFVCLLNKFRLGRAIATGCLFGMVFCTTSLYIIQNQTINDITENYSGEVSYARVPREGYFLAPNSNFFSSYLASWIEVNKLKPEVTCDFQTKHQCSGFRRNCIWYHEDECPWSCEANMMAEPCSRLMAAQLVAISLRCAEVTLPSVIVCCIGLALSCSLIVRTVWMTNAREGKKDRSRNVLEEPMISINNNHRHRPPQHLPLVPEGEGPPQRVIHMNFYVDPEALQSIPRTTFQSNPSSPP